MKLIQELVEKGILDNVKAAALEFETKRAGRTEEEIILEKQEEKLCTVCDWQEWLLILLCLIILIAGYHLVLKDNSMNLSKNDQINK